jgi:hypothetical protein
MLMTEAESASLEKVVRKAARVLQPVLESPLRRSCNLLPFYAQV